MIQVVEDQGDLVVYSPEGEYIGVFDLDYIEKFYGNAIFVEEQV